MDELKDLLHTLRYGDQTLDELRTRIDRVLPPTHQKHLASPSTKSAESPIDDHEVTNVHSSDIGAVEHNIELQVNELPRKENNGFTVEEIDKEELGNTVVQGGQKYYTPIDPITYEGKLLNGRYKLIRYMGLGRMSMVYKAVDKWKLGTGLVDPYVAVKILKRNLWSDHGWFTAFQEEAIKWQGLNHENIIKASSLDLDDSTVYLITEFVSGETLSEINYSHRFTGMSLKDTLEMIHAIGQALSFAHKRGVVHSDLYPDNIYVTDDKWVKVNNFAIVRAYSSAASGTLHPRTLDAVSLFYKSQEALEHRRSDPSDDVYSLACITYELLTGRLPFDGKLASEAQAAQMKPKKPEALSHTQWKALQAALRFDRAARTPSVSAFLKEFSTQRWSWRSVAGIFGAVTVGSVIFFLLAYILILRMPSEHRDAVIEDRSLYPEDEVRSPETQALTRLDSEQETQVSSKINSKTESSDMAAGEMKAEDSQPGLPEMAPSVQTTEFDADSVPNLPTAPVTELEQTPPAADAGWDEMTEQRQLINDLIATAYSQTMMLKLTLPEGDNALESYRKVLESQPQHQEALDGVERIKLIYLGWANTAQQAGKWEKAELYLNRALKIAPEDSLLNEELRRIRQGKIAFSQLKAETAKIKPTALTPEVPQTPPGTLPDIISIENVEHEISTASNPAVAVIKATVNGKPSKVQIFTEIKGKVTSYLMNDSDISGSQNPNIRIFTRKIPLHYPTESTQYVIAAYKQNGTVIYSPQGGVETHIIEALFQDPAVVINEFMVSNTLTIADRQGDYDDWIELYNRTPQTVDLSSYYLSDDKGDLKKWKFPQGTSIAPYGYLIVWADEEPHYTTRISPSKFELHTNFELSSQGEYVLLVNTDGDDIEILDGASFGQQPSDSSISRHPDGVGDYSVTSTPTPGRKN